MYNHTFEHMMYGYAVLLWPMMDGYDVREELNNTMAVFSNKEDNLIWYSKFHDDSVAILSQISKYVKLITT